MKRRTAKEETRIAALVFIDIRCGHPGRDGPLPEEMRALYLLWMSFSARKVPRKVNGGNARERSEFRRSGSTSSVEMSGVRSAWELENDGDVGEELYGLAIRGER